MKRMGKLMPHVHLVSRMAKSTGVDLARAAQEGDLTQAEWAGMVQRCRRCDWAEDCPDWLDAHPAGVECAPETCKNRARFAALRVLQSNAIEVG